MTTTFNEQGELVVVEIESLISIHRKYFPKVEVGYSDAGKMLNNLKRVDLEFDEITQIEVVRRCVNEDTISMLESAKELGGVQFMRGDTQVTMYGVDGKLDFTEEVDRIVVLANTIDLSIKSDSVTTVVVPRGVDFNTNKLGTKHNGTVVVTVNCINNEILKVTYPYVHDHEIVFELREGKEEPVKQAKDIVEEPGTLNDDPKAAKKAQKAEKKAQRKAAKKPMSTGKKIVIGVVGTLAVAGIGYAAVKLRK